MPSVSMVVRCGLIFSAVWCIALSADTNYLKSTIQDHFSKNRHHLINPPYKNATRGFIHAEFKKLGFETTVQPFTGSGMSDLNQREFYNVIGVLKGARFGTASDRLVGIGAHYDTVQSTSGVDDNGAGVAAMLETVRQLTTRYKNFQNTIVVVAFDIEEYLFDVDRIGSQQFVNAWLFDWLRRNYGDYSSLKPFGVIVLDTMMNYNTTAYSQTVPVNQTIFAQVFPKTFDSIKSDNFEGDFLALIYRGQSDDIELASTLQNAWNQLGRPQYEIEPFPLPIKTPDLNDPSFSDFYRSDHYHFWKNDIPAVFITDSANLRGLMVQCYHHECDNLETMLTDENVQFLGQIADAMTRTVATLTEAQTESSDATRERLLPWQLLASITTALFLL